MRSREIVMLLALGGLSGCATFDGRPTPVMTVKQADALVAPYAPDRAIADLGNISSTEDAARNTYRNRVVAAYLTAIDAHYGQFVRDLSRSGKGVHVGVDSALLLLTGAGAIFSQAASHLSAGATVVGGLRGSFDRELLADKTVPILISLMDSRRLAVRSDILRGQSKPESVYTIEDVFSDLALYEAAGTIDGALSDAAASAGAQARETQYDYSQAKDLCTVDSSTDQARRTLMISLENFERKAEKESAPADAVQDRGSIQKAALTLGIAAPDIPGDKDAAFAMLSKIRNQVELQCSVSGVAILRQKLADGGVQLP